MWVLIQDLLGRLLMAFVFSGIWYVASVFITYFLCLITKQDFNEHFKEDKISYFTNLIIIFICTILFYKDF